MCRAAHVAAIAAVLLVGCADEPMRSGVVAEAEPGNKGSPPSNTQMPSDPDAGGTLPTPSDDAGASEPNDERGDDPSTPGNDSDSSVSCGGGEGSEISCSLRTKSCCVTGFSADAATCVDGTSCAEGNRTPCDGPEDCAGNACCVDIVAGTSACANGLECGLFSPAQMCHTADDCSDGKECVRGESDKFAWWGNCT